jgi:hypothetical protein
VPNLIDHLEYHMGLIDGGWTRNGEGEKQAFQVARFRNTPVRGAMTFSTIGLSRCEMHSPVSGKRIQQELILSVPAPLAEGPVPALLQQVAGEAIASGHAYVRGDVIGPRGALFDGSSLEALYVCAPMYFPENFAVYSGPEGDIVIAWLIPISSHEAAFVKRVGWHAFEDCLISEDPDLIDVWRKPMDLPL